MSLAPRLLLAPVLFGVSLLSACPPGEPAKDGAETGDTADSGEPAVECDPVDPIVVTVTNDRGWYLDDVSVSWTTTTEFGHCEARTRDTWRCEAVAEGDVVINVTQPVYAEATATLAAGDDGCRAESEPVTFALTPTGVHFDTSRMYYQQLFEDPYECENSWEIHGMGCYHTAAFCADGYTAVMVTDILNSGVYDIGEEGRVGNVLVSLGDIPEETTWTMTSDTEMTDWLGETWKLDEDGYFDLYDCNE